MEKGKVSIIIPIHNNAEYLEKCLASLSAQTYENIEIILVNDASTDESERICADFISNEKRAILKSLEQNVGAGFARNIGIDIATGEYLLFIDSDDYVENNMVKLLVDAQTKYLTNLVICSYKTFEESRRVEERVFPFENIDSKSETTRLFSENFPDGFVGYLWNKLYLTSIVNENNIRFKNIARLEDALFNIEYFSSISSCVVIPNMLYNYRKSTQLETIKKVPENYMDLIERVYNTFLEYQALNGINYLRRISQFYYSELGTYVENTVFGNQCLILSKLAILRKRILRLNVPMFDNINLYRRVLVKMLKCRLYVSLYLLVVVKVLMKKRHTDIFFKIKDRLY